jgi:hypothetical protein
MGKGIHRFFQKVGSASTPMQQTLPSEQPNQQLLPPYAHADKVWNAPTSSFKVCRRLYACTSIVSCSQIFCARWISMIVTWQGFVPHTGS